MAVAQSLASLPDELVENIVSHVNSRTDLLSFARTCSKMSTIIIPDHLHFRRIFADARIRSAGVGTVFLERLIARPRLAANVAELVLLTDTDALPAYPWARSAAILERYASARSGAIMAPQTLDRALSSLTHLRKLELRVDEVSSRLCDVFSIACSRLRSVEDLTVTWEEDQMWTTAPVPGGALHPYLLRSTHPLWSMASSNLRALDIGSIVWLKGDAWSNVCSMLALCPALEVLSLPYFRCGPDDGSGSVTMPSLLRLRRFCVSMLTFGIQYHILSFLSSHPYLEELLWGATLFYPHTFCPALPLLRRLRVPAVGVQDQLFFKMLLTGHQPGTLPLESIYSILLTAEVLPLLAALDPTRLRKLAIAELDTLDTLRALAQTFPALEELSLPHLFRDARMLQSPPSRCKVYVHDVVPLFPRLRVVREVNAGCAELDECQCRYLAPTALASAPAGAHTNARSQYGGWPRDRVAVPQDGAARKALKALQKRYPLLESVNGWSVIAARKKKGNDKGRP